MRTSLWIVIALVTGIVGFLTGYSVSSYSGIQSIEATQAREDRERQLRGRPSDTAPGYGTEAAGYGAAEPASPTTAGSGSAVKATTPVTGHRD
jgi:hypothetical protein